MTGQLRYIIIKKIISKYIKTLIKSESVKFDCINESHAKALFQVLKKSGVTLLGGVLLVHTTYHIPMGNLDA